MDAITLSWTGALASDVSVSNSTSDIERSISTDGGTSFEKPCTFRGKSTFVPQKNRNPSLDTYCRIVEREVTSLLKPKRQYKLAHNLTESQHAELLKEKTERTIVIQSADGRSISNIRSTGL